MYLLVAGPLAWRGCYRSGVHPARRRPHAARWAVRVIRDLGEIVERGRHDELHALDGVYAGLYRTQMGADLAWRVH